MRAFFGRHVLVAAVLMMPLAQPHPRIVDVTTAHAVVDAKPVSVTDVFEPDDRSICVWFRAEHVPVGATITSVWYYLGTDPPMRFADASVLADRADDWGQFNVELAAGRRWSIGDYRVELRIGDALLAEAWFRVDNERRMVER